MAAETPKLIHEFRVTNTTGRPVKITDVNHSCTCSDVILEGRSLGLGESLTMTMEVNVPKGYAKLAPFTVLKTDHPEYPEWHYQVRFESYPNARIVPNVIRLGPGESGLQDNTHKPSYLEVFAPLDEPLPLPGRIVSPQSISAFLGPRPEVDMMPGGLRRGRYTLDVELEDDSGGVRASYSRELKITTNAGEPASAMVVWETRGPIAVTPAAVHFGMVDQGSPSTVSRSAVIRSVQGEPFRLLSAESDSPNVAIRLAGNGQLPSPRAAEHEIELDFTPQEGGATVPFSAGTARILVDLERTSDVTLPWSAFLRRSERSPAVAAGE